MRHDSVAKKIAIALAIFGGIALLFSFLTMKVASGPKTHAIPKPTSPTVGQSTKDGSQTGAGTVVEGQPPSPAPVPTKPSLSLPERRAAEMKIQLAAVDAAVEGSATFQAPAEARKAESFEVTLLVLPGELQPLRAFTKTEAKAKTAAAQMKGITALSRTNIEVVATEAILVPKMSASLSGIGFKLSPDGEQQQSILLGTPTRWTWQVSSTEDGLRTLSVRLSGHVTLEGSEVQRNFYAYTHDVKVSIGLLGLIENYWQWITTTLLLPLMAWAWSQYRKRDAPPTQLARVSLSDRLRRRKSGDA